MRNKLLLTITVCLWVMLSFGQETKVVGDLRLHSTLKIQKEFLKKLETEIEFESRFEKNITQVKEYNVTLQANYQIIKRLDLGIGYRSTFQPDDNAYNTENRLSAEANYKNKFHRFKYSIRLRFQNTDDDYNSNENNSVNILRYRGLIKYNIRKNPTTPYVGYELYSFSDSNFDLKKQKWLIGFKYGIKKLGDIDLYYRIDQELNNPNPFTYYTIGTGLTFTF